MKVATANSAIATVALVGLLYSLPAAAQTQCETPTPAGIAMCLESPAFQTNLDYRYHTRLLMALGTEYYQNPDWIAAVLDWLTDKLDLTGKTGTRYAMDWYFKFLFNQSLGIALSVNEPMDIYLLMGQSNMYLHGNGPQLTAAIQNFTDAITQAWGAPDRTVVTINCAVPGSPIMLWDPQPSPLYGSPTCETSASLARCTNPPTGCQQPKLCSCNSSQLDFCSNGISWVDATRHNGGWSPMLTGDARDRYNLTRHCLETARALKNAAGQTGVIKGMFYHQGESDTGTAATVASWANSYKNIVNFLRTSLGAQIPVIHAQIRGGSSPTALWQQLQVNQRLVQAEIPKSAFICTNDLTVAADNIHIDGPGHVIMGNRFGNAMLHLLLGWAYNPAVEGCTPT